MDKYPISFEWFTKLRAIEFHKPDTWQWLFQLHSSVDKIASFGCMSSEPFFLVWGLDVTKAKVIEVEKKFISERLDEMEELRLTIPNAFEGRIIDFIQADMRTISEKDVQSNFFDLAFCRRVLYQVFLDSMEQLQGEAESQKLVYALNEVKNAISQMARITHPGGFVIAVESIAKKLGDERISIDPLFQATGMHKVLLEGAPEDAYIYRK